VPVQVRPSVPKYLFVKAHKYFYKIMKLYLRILSYIKPYIPALALSLLLTLCFSAANVFFLPLTRDLIKEITNKNLQFFNIHVFSAIGLYSVRLITQFSQYYLSNYISYKMSLDLQMDLYRKLQYMSSHFYSNWKLGDILTRLFSDVSKLKEPIVMTFADILPNSLTLIGILGYLFYLNWKLTIFTFLAVPLFVFIVMYTGNILKRVARQVQRKTADISHITQETLTNIRLVQAYTMEEQEINKFKTESTKNIIINMKGIRIKAIVEPLIAFLQFLVITSIIWYGAYQISKGTMSGATLTSFFAGIFLLIDPVLALSRVYTNLQQAFVSANRFFSILDTPAVISNVPNAKKMSINGDVVFQNVDFSYKKEEGKVLNDICLHAKKGEVIALVGLSGVGKSTLINLIPRFYDPSSGLITIDGVNIKEIDIYSLRSQIGIVPQDDILFRGTILNNVRYGKIDATDEEIKNACEQANAWEFIEKLGWKLRSRVQDRGTNFSGGQKQRISIARAILRDPKILILDEATSSLDPESEMLVQDALDKLMKNRTTFVIAHRLSTIMHADKIVVMEKGAIAEVGKHDELLAKDGVYSKLYNLQFRKKDK
jgi:ATP-binding cassette, subfamily B, bacterial MsbA